MEMLNDRFEFRAPYYLHTMLTFFSFLIEWFCGTSTFHDGAHS